VNYEQFVNDLGQLFTQFKDKFFAIVPDLIFAVIIVLIGILVARLLKTVVNRLINRIDKLIPSSKLRNRLKKVSLERSAQIVAKLVYWIIIVFFLTAATEILGLPIITTWLGGLVHYLPNILIAVIIVFLGIVLGKLVRDLISSAADSAGLLYGTVLAGIGRYAILLITILIAVNQIGIDIAILTGIIDIVLAAILFGAALAFGLGAKISVSNILASYYVQNWYKEGQLVRIGDKKGRIIQFTSTAVILETSDGQLSIPAKKFSEDTSTLIIEEGLTK
jgi:hypothetical protein